MMYFMSKDGNIILSSGDNFDYENKKEVSEYDLLLNSIK